MSFIKLQFKPGIDRDQTNYGNEGGWYECDKVRFRSGSPEKIGGWKKTIGAGLVGYIRQLHNWTTPYPDDFLALGSNKKVYIEKLGTYFDITPLRDVFPTISSPDTDNSIATLVDSNVVTFTLASPHLALDGNFVEISGVDGPGGLVGGIPVGEINGNHEIDVLNPTQFTIKSTTLATASTFMQGGTVISISFELPPGNAIAVLGDGWGTGTWGRMTWGSGSLTGVNLLQRDWWFDNFGNDLVMNIRRGPIYWWERGTVQNAYGALHTKAIRLYDYAYNTAITAGMTPAEATTYANAVPSKVMQVMVSQQDRHVIAFGAVPFGSTDDADFDPLLIRWADQDTPTDWTPQVLNTAGDIRLSRGSRIIRALPVRQEILVFTDARLYTMQFLGTTDVFGVQEYADNVSIIGPRAVVTAAGVTYWMGQDKFYAYTGRVETLPCTLRSHVFDNLNFKQVDQIVCGTNEQWNEVWWFYPSKDASYNDSYVIFNTLEQIWYYGKMARTAWLDSTMRVFPLACNTEGGTDTAYLYSHETAVDDDGAPMSAYIMSSDFDLGDGDQFMLTRRYIPDIKFEGSVVENPEVKIQLRPRNFPGGPMFADADDEQRVISSPVGLFTEQIFIRARARHLALRVSSETLGVHWQVGAPRVDVRQDGRRG